MIRIEFVNSQDKPIYIQVDPWACLYRLDTGERIEFVVDCYSDDQSFCIDEYDNENRILTLWNCEEFYILQNGKRVFWEEFQTNI